MLTRTLLAAAGAALLAACTSQEPTARDAEGHYATTSEYSEMNRTELVAAMDAGLVDVDRRRLELEQRAEVLGQDAIDELHDREAELAEARTEFVNELARLRASLDADWKARGEDTVEAFEDLRDELDNAYEEVLEEA